MFRFDLRSNLARFAITPALTLWIAGAGCLFGCESAHAAQSHNSGTLAAGKKISAAPACHAHVKSECCAMTEEIESEVDRPVNRTLVIANQPDHGLAQCPMGLNSYTAANQSRTSRIAISPIQNSVQLLRAEEHPISISHQIPILNRSGTHLRCCVFLI